MSDDKKAEAIEQDAWWCRDCEDYKPYSTRAKSGDKFCTECGTTCVLVPDVRPLRAQLANVERENRALTCALKPTTVKELETQLAEATAKLEAAEGRVRELEDAAREVPEQYGFGGRETVPIHERTAISVLAGLVPLPQAQAAAWVREQATEPPDDTCPCGQRYGEYGHDH